MPIRIIESKQNARLKELRRALAEPGREANGLAGVEGPNLLEEALRAGLRIRTVFAGERLQQWVQAVRLPHETEVLVMPSGILASVLSTETPQPVAALVEPPDWTWAHLLGDRKDASAMIVVLAGLQDPGNLGTILRSAEAFGATGVVCLPGTVNAWNPKAVRASAGSIFRVPLLYAGEREAMTMLREAGVRMLTTTAQGAQPVDLADLAQPVALMIGNEGNGVPPDLATKADGAVTIPCPGPVESLNAAVAAGVMLYEAARQRAAKSGGPRERRGGTR
ncbi:MAG TPA: RNA methyltransferase [Terracidiphilus sp.]|nr:RNA methyltransferase [Terracidiphilus sp.]